MQIGYIVFGIILIPLIGSMVVSTLLKPRTFLVSAQFTLVLILCILALIGGFILFVWALRLIVPQ